MISTYLKELKADNKVKKNITVAEWSKLSGVPVDTISKYLSGQTRNPNFQTVCDMILSLGGSVDSALGISTGDVPQNVVAAQAETALAYRDVIQLKDDIIAGKDAIIASKSETIATQEGTIRRQSIWNRIFFGFALVALFVAVYFIWDASHGGMGMIRYPT